MKALSHLVAVAGLGLALAGPAQAATLSTAGVGSPLGNLAQQDMACNAVNKRGVPVVVKIESHDETGIGLNAIVTTMPAYTAASLAAGSASYCTFAVQGSAKYVQAAAVFRDQVTGHYVAAIPAQ